MTFAAENPKGGDISGPLTEDSQGTEGGGVPVPGAEQQEEEEEETSPKGGPRGCKGDRPNLPKPTGIVPCPRCKSNDTKFCYYNNYNINQPRYYCRACQRYWTVGGVLRDVPVGSGRRRNKNNSRQEHQLLSSQGGPVQHPNPPSPIMAQQHHQPQTVGAVPLAEQPPIPQFAMPQFLGLNHPPVLPNDDTQSLGSAISLPTMSGMVAPGTSLLFDPSLAPAPSPSGGHSLGGTMSLPFFPAPMGYMPSPMMMPQLPMMPPGGSRATAAGLLGETPPILQDTSVKAWKKRHADDDDDDSLGSHEAQRLKVQHNKDGEVLDEQLNNTAALEDGEVQRKHMPQPPMMMWANQQWGSMAGGWPYAPFPPPWIAGYMQMQPPYVQPPDPLQGTPPPPLPHHQQMQGPPGYFPPAMPWPGMMVAGQQLMFPPPGFGQGAAWVPTSGMGMPPPRTASADEGAAMKEQNGNGEQTTQECKQQGATLVGD